MEIGSNNLNNYVENQLIISCSQTSLYQEQIESITQAINNNPDWKYIIMVASRNGVFPLISWNLLKHFSELLPPEISKQLNLFFQKHTQNNLLMTRKLIDIVNLLEKERISILPFKGTTLAMQAYNNLALRQYCDLDILVKPKNFDQTVKVLSENGYKPVSEVNWLKRKTLFFTHKKDIVLVDNHNIVQIELHWKLSGSHFSLPLEISLLWDRLKKLNIGGTELNALPFDDLFIYLCLHGSRHEWERLSWICDLRELIKSVENAGEKINWETLGQHARKHGCERVVELGLFLVQHFFGVVTEYPGYEKIKANQSFAAIAEQVERRLFSVNFTPSLKAEKYLYLLSLQEKRTHRIKLYLVYLTFYLKLILTPNTLDKSIFHLPKLLFPLYFILRPIRLLINYFHIKSAKKEVLEK